MPIVCTSDYQKGFLYKGAKYLQLLHSLYHSYQEKCKQLFEVIRYLPMDGSLQQMYQFSPSYDAAARSLSGASVL